jgi:hypothetical protein
MIKLDMLMVLLQLGAVQTAYILNPTTFIDDTVYSQCSQSKVIPHQPKEGRDVLSGKAFDLMCWNSALQMLLRVDQAYGRKVTQSSLPLGRATLTGVVSARRICHLL